ncbi:migration and invasion inhibitory protein [Vanacampus margaritifer]
MCERQTGSLGSISSPSLAAVPLSEISPQRDDNSGPSAAKSCLVHHSKEQKGVRVSFQNSEDSDELASDSSHSLRPLLGYDWIAGVLDVEKSLQNRSNDFYKELQDFRLQNESECMHQPQAKISPHKQSVLSLFVDTDSLNGDIDHQCTYLYRLNSRLFPVPVPTDECCPVCQRPKSSHPHTKDKPAHVRVSIPRATLQPPYDYKPHRRSSFDPADGLGLPSHCLLGWSNAVRSYLRPPSNLDLRSHLEKRTEQPEDQVSRSFQYERAPPIVPLARHRFQHFSPKRKKQRTASSSNN